MSGGTKAGAVVGAVLSVLAVVLIMFQPTREIILSMTTSFFVWGASLIHLGH